MDEKRTSNNTFKNITAIAAIMAAVIAFAVVIVFLVGGQRNVRSGSIVEFSYGSGSGMGGYVQYTLKRQDNLALLEINRSGVPEDKAGDIKKTIDGEYLDRLATIINENEVARWDGFDKSDSSILDGDGFVLKVKYDDEKTIEAHGYMIYPGNYRVVTDKFVELFSEMEQL